MKTNGQKWIKPNGLTIFTIYMFATAIVGIAIIPLACLMADMFENVNTLTYNGQAFATWLYTILIGIYATRRLAAAFIRITVRIIRRHRIHKTNKLQKQLMELGYTTYNRKGRA